jgi:hypothetical protein
VTPSLEVGAASPRVLGQLTQVRKRAGRDLRLVKLGHLAGHLLAFGRAAADDLMTGRLIVVTAPLAECDLGDVDVRWVTEQHALGRCLSGWVVVRVSAEKKLVAPSVLDLARTRSRLRELGWDPARAPFEQRRWAT